DFSTPAALLPMKIVPVPCGSTAMASTAAGLGPMLVHAPSFCWDISRNGKRHIPIMTVFRSLMVIFTSPPYCISTTTAKYSLAGSWFTTAQLRVGPRERSSSRDQLLAPEDHSCGAADND